MHVMLLMGIKVYLYGRVLLIDILDYTIGQLIQTTLDASELCTVTTSCLKLTSTNCRSMFPAQLSPIQEGPEILQEKLCTKGPIGCLFSPFDHERRLSLSLECSWLHHLWLCEAGPLTECAIVDVTIR
ncbi:hypothetical protein EDC96DRAFT_569833 [Choanephora cucurbitarum]|nr:hypothetical protein EDC96DRAFT_569833 [Choanephora cucurbitarum]